MQLLIHYDINSLLIFGLNIVHFIHFIRFATQVLGSKSITCDLSELPHQQLCGCGNKYPWCSKGKVLGQSWRWCLYRSKVPLTDKEDCVQVPCKAELVRTTLQISVGIAPPYLTSLMRCIKLCFVFMGVSGDSQLGSCPDPTLTLVLCSLVNQCIHYFR